MYDCCGPRVSLSLCQNQSVWRRVQGHLQLPTKLEKTILGYRRPGFKFSLLFLPLLSPSLFSLPLSLFLSSLPFLSHLYPLLSPEKDSDSRYPQLQEHLRPSAEVKRLGQQSHHEHCVSYESWTSGTEHLARLDTFFTFLLMG